MASHLQDSSTVSLFTAFITNIIITPVRSGNNAPIGNDLVRPSVYLEVGAVGIREWDVLQQYRLVDRFDSAQLRCLHSSQLFHVAVRSFVSAIQRWILAALLESV